ncbi:hypothetical protein [Cohnella panacarvi]|uniref:hypothetical protein n=1 Tax=Cohnella panacarvi TaxID=400776 RepID=UPI00047CC830|nr:hypothetical protein [Cohnella panacarvi]
MMIAAAVAAVSIGIALFEVTPLRRQGLWKELWTFAALLLLGTVLGIARALHIPIWNPTHWITFAFKPVNEWLIGMIN